MRDPENGQLIMSNMVWLIEDCIFSDKEKVEEAKKIILSFGDDYHDLTGNEPHGFYPYSQLYGLINNPSSALCSLAWARTLGFYEKEKYWISNYSNYLGEDFLNHDFVFLPLGMLADASEDTVDRVSGLFMHSNSYFIKPNSGFKQFTGEEVDFDEIGEHCRYLIEMGVPKDTICLISSGKKIEHEWRFWVIDNKLVTHSYYSWEDDGIEYEPTEDIILEAERIAKKFVDLKNFTLDLCLWNGKVKVVEINNIYTSGTYNCNLRALLKELRRFAIKEHSELDII